MAETFESEILDRMERTPMRFASDRGEQPAHAKKCPYNAFLPGSEFISAPFKNLCKQKGIAQVPYTMYASRQYIVYHSHVLQIFSQSHASLAEVFNRIVKQKLYKILHDWDREKYRSPEEFKKLLSNIETSLNNRKSRKTGLTPVEVNAKNAMQVFKTLYPQISGGKINKFPKNAYKIGDTVRLSLEKSAFLKSSRVGGYTKELYRIAKIHYRRGPLQYSLVTVPDGEPLLGRVYHAEIVRAE